MAWEIAVIVDPNYDPRAAGSLDSDMPLWVVDTPANRTFAKKLQEAATYVWLEEPICTTFRVMDLNAREDNCLSILDIVIQHHPKMAKLHLVGVQNSERLVSAVGEFGFISFEPNQSGVVFVKPLSSMENAPHLQLDATSWNKADDIYESLFALLGAPAWHGKNFDALQDSIVEGNINSIEVPYTLSIQNMKSANFEVRQFIFDLVNLISGGAAKGCPVAIQIEDDLQ